MHASDYLLYGAIGTLKRDPQKEERDSVCCSLKEQESVPTAIKQVNSACVSDIMPPQLPPDPPPVSITVAVLVFRSLRELILLNVLDNPKQTLWHSQNTDEQIMGEMEPARGRGWRWPGSTVSAGVTGRGKNVRRREALEL